jgi:RNA polymerase sigma factor (sigma-70 family)
MRIAGQGGNPQHETLEQAVSAAPADPPVPQPVSGSATGLAGFTPRPSGTRATPSGDGSDLTSTVELTVRAQSGDQAALEALCLRCLRSVSRYAAGRLPQSVRDMLDTQDVALEAVQRGLSRLHEFEVRHPGALIAYMRTILRHLIVDHVRARSRMPARVSLDDQQPDRGRSPLECVLSAEQIQLYEEALSRLRPRDAALVTLRVEEQLGHDEIAAELGFASGNAARVAAKRAVLRLALEMSRLSQTRLHQDRTAAVPDASRMRDAS